jgi:hypothetical protein
VLQHSKTTNKIKGKKKKRRGSREITHQKQKLQRVNPGFHSRKKTSLSSKNSQREFSDKSSSATLYRWIYVVEEPIISFGYSMTL